MFFSNLLFFGSFICVYNVSLSHLALPLPISFLKFLILIIQENVWRGDWLRVPTAHPRPWA